MNEFKGTPGPWFVEDGALGNEHLIVVSKQFPFEMMSKENLNLIAAAPELLEALQEMVAIVKKHTYPQPDKPSTPYARAEWAESIINKALGETK